MKSEARVLMVDDEPNVLSGYRRTVGRHCHLSIAEGGVAALKILDEEGPFGVVITDMRMPEMDGVAFLRAALEKHKDTVYAMLTGNADQQTAIDAINQGKIFRFLNKPCSPEMLLETIEACHHQYELIRAEKVLLKGTLSGCVKLLVEATSLASPEIGAIVSEVRQHVQQLASFLKLPPDWRLGMAGSLFLLGRIAVPESSVAEMLKEEHLAASAEAGANLLRHIPRMNEVSQMVARQRETGSLPTVLTSRNAEDQITIGARLLKFSVDWARARLTVEGDDWRALSEIRESEAHDKRLYWAAEKVLSESADEGQQRTRIELPVTSLKPDMITDQTITTQNGQVLVTAGQLLTEIMVERLHGFARLGRTQETAWVLVPNNAIH